MKIGKARPKGIAGTTPVRKKGDPLPDDYKFGCPPLYRPEYCDAIINYFDRDPWDLSFDAKGTGKALPKDKLPTLARFAREIGVGVRTVHDWIDRYPEFGQAHEVAKDLQKSYIMESGGITLNANFATFMLRCNHGMKEPEDPNKDKGDLATQLAELIGKMPS